MSTIGTLRRQTDGSYVGKLKTLTISADISIVPVTKKVAVNGPDYMVWSKDVEIGAAWKKKGQRSGKDYISVSLSAPEFGNKPLYANIGPKAGSDDTNEYVLIWNPQTGGA